jgi:hypothetical protein
MTRIIVNGARGRMGRALVACAKNFPELEIAGQIDRGDDLAAVIAGGDVVVDFSGPAVTAAVAALCARHQKALDVELFHRRQCALLAHPQGGGDSRTGFRPGNHRNASSSQTRCA